MSKKLPFGALLLVSLLFSWKMFPLLDLDPQDEALYVSGKTLATPPAEWAPLYSHWYAFLSLWTQENAVLYFVNFFLVSALFLPAGIYLLSRRLGFTPWSAAVVAVMALMSCSNFPVMPRVQIFNFTFLLWIFLFLKTRDPRHWKNVLFHVLSAMSIFFRQDNLFFVFIFLFYDLSVLFGFRKEKAVLAWGLGTFAAPGLALAAAVRRYGSPFANGRVWRAYMDHFATSNLDVLSEKSLQQLPAQEAVRIFFEGAESLPQAMLTKPLVFLSALSRNWKIFVYEFPSSMWVYGGGALIFSLFILLAALLNREPEKREDEDSKKLFFLFLLGMLIRVLITNSLFHPFPRYYAELVFLLPVVLVVSLGRFLKGGSAPSVFKTRVLAASFLCACLLLMMRGQRDFLQATGVRAFSARVKSLKIGDDDRVMFPCCGGGLVVFGDISHAQIVGETGNLFESGPAICGQRTAKQIFGGLDLKYLIYDAETRQHYGSACLEIFKELEAHPEAANFKLLAKDEFDNYIFERKAFSPR